MKFINKQLDNLAKLLSENSKYSYEACLYLIRTYLHLFSSIVLIALIAYMLNVEIWTGIIILTVMILRAFSGGGHSQSKIVCTSISLIVPVGFGLLINNVIISNELVLIWSVAIFIVGLLILLKYSPADTPQKPIISTEFKNQLRRKSIAFITFITIVIVELYHIEFVYFYQVSLSLLVGLTWQLFTVLPIGYSFLRFVDSLFYTMGGNTKCDSQFINRF